MARITNKSDISWFKLSNYDYLDKLDTETLERELLSHLEYLEWTKEHFEKMDSLGEQLWSGLSPNDSLLGVNPKMDEQWSKISEGNPRLQTENDCYGDVAGNFIWESNAISGYSVHAALSHALYLDLEITKPLVEDRALEYVDLFLQERLQATSKLEKVTVEIDLKNHTDREITTQLINLLKPWRDQLGIPEPDGIKIKRSDHYLNLLKYQIIPLIDLKRWEKITGNSIEDEVISILLYTNDSDVDFSRTVMGFYNNIIENNYREAMVKRDLKMQ
jgi:hypothetical protein